MKQVRITVRGSVKIQTVDLFSDKMLNHNVSSKNFSCRNSENWPTLYHCHVAKKYLDMVLNMQVQVKQELFQRQEDNSSEN